MFLNYDINSGRILGYFDENIIEHKQNFNDLSVKLSTELAKELANGDKYYIAKPEQLSNLDRNIILTMDEIDLYFFDTFSVPQVVEERVDKEKLAMAEAIADLYEQLLMLQGGV